MLVVPNMSSPREIQEPLEHVVTTTASEKSEESPEEKPSKEPRAWANEARPPHG